MAGFDVMNETVVLSSMLCNSEFLDLGLTSLRPEDFLGSKHAIIFGALERCLSRGFDLTPKNIAYHAEEDDYGGAEYLEDLMSGKAVAANETEFRHHLRHVLQDAARHRASRRVRKLETALLDKSRRYEECEDELADLLVDLHVARDAGEASTRDLMDEWDGAFKRRQTGEEVIFISTGIEALDQVSTEGFARGSITVIAGRPRMGKTILLTDLVRRSLQQRPDERILVVPFEKTPMYFLNLLISSISRVELEVILKYTDQMTDDELHRVHRASSFIRTRMNAGVLTVLESPMLRLIQSEERWGEKRALGEVEKMLAKGKYAKVYFDLVERVLADSPEPQKLARGLFRLQTFCPKYDLHIIFTQQLSRRAEDLRQQGSVLTRPTLTDLKNTGAYEEIVDNAILIYREKVFRSRMRADVIELILAKQKQGAGTHMIHADFHPEICRLRNDRISYAAPLRDLNIGGSL